MGAPRIYGESLMLGIEVAESIIGRYMVRRRPPSQCWKTFLDKNAPDFRCPQRLGPIASIAILGGLHHQYVRV